MTIDNFNNLSISEQENAVMAYGTHLLRYDQANRACQIYKLFDFFVKLCYESSNIEDHELISFSNYEDFHLYEHHAFALMGEL